LSKENQRVEMEKNLKTIEHELSSVKGERE